ncbi:MAG TPA: holo-ACP synthase [Bellilinea sp.]
MILRTGVDILEIDRMDSVSPAIRRRFIQRVYTPAEREILGEDNEALAGRFAAKEAVSKALGSGIGFVRWQDIEVLNGPYGEPVLNLYGNAVKIAEALGLDTWSVSISHSRNHAVAVAVAIGQDGPVTDRHENPGSQ